MKITAYRWVVVAAGLFPAAVFGQQNCGCDNRAACATCQPVVQHIHKYRHHHCAPPCGVVVPSMAMMPVMAAPMQYAPVAAAPVQYAPVAAAPVYQAPAAAPVQLQVQAAPVQYAIQAAPAAPQFTLTQQAAPQYALVQVKGSEAAPRAPASEEELYRALADALKARSPAAAPASPAAAPSKTLEERVTDLEGRMSEVEKLTLELGGLVKRHDADIRKLKGE